MAQHFHYVSFFVEVFLSLGMSVPSTIMAETGFLVLIGLIMDRILTLGLRLIELLDEVSIEVFTVQ